jgi:Fe-S-cluster-containing dehydrogenase component
MAACAPKVMRRSDNKGAVTNVGPDRTCIACSMCLMACPFGAISRGLAPDGRLMALKCDLCPDLATPACVRACPTGALAVKQGATVMAGPAVARVAREDGLAGLSASAAARILAQIAPDDRAPDPHDGAGRLLAMLEQRRNGGRPETR